MGFFLSSIGDIAGASCADQHSTSLLLPQFSFHGTFYKRTVLSFNIEMHDENGMERTGGGQLVVCMVTV